MMHRYMDPDKHAGPLDRAARALEDLHRRVSLLEATPEAAELADAEGIDLSKVHGSGEGGRVLKSDVAAAIDAREAAGE